MPGDKRKRTRLKAIRFTPDELSTLEATAERAGLSVGAYVRSALLAAPIPRQSRRPPIERVRLAELLAHIGKLGSNVNQLAKYGNMGQLIDNAALDQAAADIALMRSAVMTALGRGDEGDHAD